MMIILLISATYMNCIIWKDDDWKSLGTKISGYSQQLVYNNVPNDALFLLRNHTEGNEERIFTYDGEKQIWW